MPNNNNKALKPFADTTEEVSKINEIAVILDNFNQVQLTSKMASFNNICNQLNLLIRNREFKRPENMVNAISAFHKTILSGEADELLTDLSTLVNSVKENPINSNVYYYYKFFIALAKFNFVELEKTHEEIARFGISTTNYDHLIIEVAEHLQNNVSGLTNKEKLTLIQELFTFSICHKFLFTDPAHPTVARETFGQLKDIKNNVEATVKTSQHQKHSAQNNIKRSREDDKEYLPFINFRAHVSNNGGINPANVPATLHGKITITNTGFIGSFDVNPVKYSKSK